jgi:hypothetical protein
MEKMDISEGKFVAVHILKAYRRSGCIAPHMFNFGAGWKRVVNFTPRPLYTRESISVPTNREKGGPHSCYGGYWGREKPLALCGALNSCHPAVAYSLY